MMMKPLGAALGLSLSAAAVTGAMAQQMPVVLELYTSQGCSSCPAADALLDSLADDPSLLPLALHVDYWDYIGWADTFAQPIYTDRQKAYARAAGERMIYTPQMIVGGVTRVEGNDPEAVAAAIAAGKAALPEVALQVTREGSGLRIRAEAMTSAAAPDGGAPMKLQLVRFQPEAVVEITRGENEGRTVTYRNIVADWQAVADWPGSPALDLLLPVSGEDPVAILLQRAAPQGGPGAIVAAVRLD